MAPTLAEVAAVAGCDYDFINNAVRREYFVTELRPTRAGVAREFTRENALEIAFLRALTAQGETPSAARAITKTWLGLESLKKLPQWYVANLKTRESSFAKTTEIRSENAIENFARRLPDSVDESELVSDDQVDEYIKQAAAGGHQAEDEPATCLVVICLEEIVCRVDELFQSADRWSRQT